MKKFITLGFIGFVGMLLSCQPNAKQIIEEAVEAHGGAEYEQLDVSFDFRNMQYRIEKNDGGFRYTRKQTDSTGQVTTDVLSNDGMIRQINGRVVDLPDSMVQKYSSSINSVAYFFLLPGPLLDPAVQTEFLGEESIRGKAYDKIRVTFKADGGGEDHQDVFVYWIDKKLHVIDYFAYAYATNGGGVRFREAIDVQVQNGLRFCNYINYGSEDLSMSVESMGKLFDENKLKEVSRIINSNVQVKK